MMYDLAVIGAGAGGIDCVKAALKAGLKTVLLEKDPKRLGGVCLNQGCIPTKFLINSVKAHKNWQQAWEEKETLVKKIRGSLHHYLSAQGVVIRWGEASFLDKNTLKVGTQTIAARHIIIACGSAPKKIIDNEKSVFAEELFDCAQLPQRFLIAGAGYIGIEFASLLHSWGKDVCVAEKEKEILPFFDRALARRLRGILERRGIKIDTDKDIAAYNLGDFDRVVIAGGRVPNTAGLGLARVGILTDEQGAVKTDRYLKTNLDNIYACGDATGRRLLAYVAQYQAKLCIENIQRRRKTPDYSAIPECVFSTPQAAAAGIREEEAAEKRIKYRLIRSNFLKFPSSYVYDDIQGFAQLLIDERDRIIGAGIISNQAAELINVFSLCMRNALTLKELRNSLFIHPTLSEIILQLLDE